MRSKLFRGIIAVISLAVFIFSGYKLYDYFRSSKADKDYTNTIIENAVDIKPHKHNTEKEEEIDLTDPNKCPIDVDFKTIWKENKDVIAWIYSPNTEINYPVAQSYDNSRYLRTRLDGKYSVGGTIFVDYRNSSDFSDPNSIIYGHFMRNGTMFGSLQKYKSQEYYDQHPFMWLITPDKTYRIDILSGFVTPSDSEIYDYILDKSGLEEYLSQTVNKSTFISNIDWDKAEKAVTLSTCSHDYKDARYVVIGSLIEVDS